ncbi:hypothetical protein [Paenibacillus prosopidis]|uniref:Uncharacterized protein n=1 Tax=Paenibacillus prosopidis TaxID=630520 RepID=A0A368VZX8_9BACL|nr:hypothetical protein [Paenibacillus prosopidis]RCW46459.1 hypothetical protein DFP97_109102 [Paenibacillus prosopidis]
MAMKLSEIFDRTAAPSREELRLIYDYIILPLVLKVVKHNQRELDKKARSLRSVFVRAADLIIAKIDTDLTISRRKMLNQNIVVNEINSVHNYVTYQINYHGYEERLTFSREYLLTEINTSISTYTSEIFLKK